MKSMHKILWSVLLIALLVNPAVAQQAIRDSSSASDPEFQLHGRLQTLGFAQSVNDNVADHQRVYLFLKQARLMVSTTYEDVKFDLQLGLGGEEIVLAPSPGIALTLLDLSADIPISQSFSVKVGQFKVPYGREGMTNSGYLQFNDRSIQFLAFRLGRDVGLTLHSSSGNFSSALGVFTGGGRDVPIRYLPESLGFPMIVLRVGINSGLDEDVLTLKQTNHELSEGAVR